MKFLGVEYECERTDRSDAGQAQAFVAAMTRIAFCIASWRRPLRARRPSALEPARADFLTRLAAAADAQHLQASANAATLTSASLDEVDECQAAAAPVAGPSARRGRHGRRPSRVGRRPGSCPRTASRRQRLLLAFEHEEGLAAALPRHQVAGARERRPPMPTSSSICVAAPAK
jgi:hypothetical protein